MKLRRSLQLFLPIFLCLASGTVAAVELPAVTPHGILVDRVLPLAHLEELDGSSAAPAATPARWRQVVHELTRSAAVDPGWPTAADLHGRPAARNHDSRIHLGLVHARYDRLDEAGNLTAGEVFTCAPLVREVYHGADLELVLDPTLMLRHRAPAARAFTLDADDGRGPRTVAPGEALPVRYGRTGVRTLTLTAELVDGRNLTARTILDIKRLVIPEPDQILPLTASVAWDGAFASGEAYVLLAPGHAALENPVVVVEGFDLDNTMDWPVLYDLLNQQNLLQDLLGDGYDAVVLNFAEATEPIQRNAFVLTELLSQLDAQLPPGRSLAVVGASMGGLVSRYALTWMENQGLEHRARTWISFDAPQGGANIPLGIQHWLTFFQAESSEAAFLLERLNTPAARQMLLYHHTATGNGTAGASDRRAQWLADMDAIGSWPTQPQRVAVANGSGTMQDQGFGPGDQIIDYTYRSFLVDVDGNVWAVPDGGGTQTIFDGGLDLLWPLPDTFLTVGVGGTEPWDGAPGGSRDSMAQMDAVAAPYGDIIALHDSHCFIPTVSALALEGVGPFHDIAGDADLMTRTAFDRVYWPQENQGHILITAENKTWFLAEMSEGISSAGDGHDLASMMPEKLQAAPNPFNPSTELSFILPQAGPVSLWVYDVKGRRIRTLADGALFAAGRQTVNWNGRDDAGVLAASGVYLVRLESSGMQANRRVVLAK